MQITPLFFGLVLLTKCNGIRPCQRCSHLRLDCVYPSGPHVRRRIRQNERERERKQETQARKSNNNNGSNGSNGPNGPAKEDQESWEKISCNVDLSPDVPTTFYNIRSRMDDDASSVDNSASALGGGNLISDSNSESAAPDSCESKPANVEPPIVDGGPIHNNDSPQSDGTSGYGTLWGIPPEDAKMMLESYDSEVNCLYPMFREGELVRKYEEAFLSYSLQGKIDEQDPTLQFVKLGLGCGSTILDIHKQAAAKLSEDVIHGATSVMNRAADLNMLILLLMIHQYEFHCDMGTICYRTLGFASVVALELGLYRAGDLQKKEGLSAAQKEFGRLVFWCLYVMDRRLAIYTKRPCVLDDEDIDQKLPRYYGTEYMPFASSEDMVRATHLTYMIYYSQIAGKFLKGDPSGKSAEHFENLLKQWQQSLPPELNISNFGNNSPPGFSRKLSAMLYFKLNLILLNIYMSKKSETYSFQAVDAARKVIRKLAKLYFETGMYTSCEIQYNHFLVTALEVLYSAAKREPATYGDLCAHEIQLAHKLIKIILKTSRSEKRGTIWSLITSFAVKLGMNTSRRRITDEPSSTSNTSFKIEQLDDTGAMTVPPTIEEIRSPGVTSGVSPSPWSPKSDIFSFNNFDKSEMNPFPKPSLGSQVTKDQLLSLLGHLYGQTSSTSSDDASEDPKFPIHSLMRPQSPFGLRNSPSPSPSDDVLYQALNDLLSTPPQA